MSDMHKLCQQADALYLQRHLVDNAQKSLLIAQQAASLAPQNFEPQWRVARAATWLADLASEPGQKQALSKQAWDAAAQALAQEPNNIDVVYWGASALGSYANALGYAQAFLSGLGARFEELMRHAVALDPKYDHAGPLRALARYYMVVPGILGGSDAKAIALFKRSVLLAPDSLRTRWWLAELHQRRGATQNARDVFSFCASADPQRGDIADNLRVQPLCQRAIQALR